MKKLMLIAIVGMFAVTAFAAPPTGGPSRGLSGGRGPTLSPRVERRDPPRHGGMSDDMARAVGITHIVRDSVDILGTLFGRPNPPPPPRVIAPAPVIVTPAPTRSRTVIVTPTTSVVTTTPVVTTPVVQEVVVEKPVVVEKEIKKIEPVIISDKIYFKVTYTDGTTSYVKQD